MRATLTLLVFLMSCSILSMQTVAQEYDEHDEALGRLLVADGETGLLQLIELDNGEVIETFMVEGSARVYTTESGRIAVAVQTGANSVNFIDSGLYLEAHGDHFDKEKGRPSLLPFNLTGELANSQRPIHFVSHDGRVNIHFDGNFGEGVDSKNVTVREEDLFLSNPDTLILTSAPQHGAGAPVHGGKIIFSLPDPDREFGSLPSGFAVVDEQGNIVQTFNDKEDFQASCLGMHGETIVGEHFIAGCNEKREDGTGDGGVFVMTHDPVTGLFSAHKIAYPDGLRTSIVRSHHAQPFAIGNYGSNPEPGYRALVRIHPDSTELDPNDIQELPAAYRGFDFEEEHGDKLVVLTVDGLLQVFNPSDWTLLGSTQVVADFSDAEGLRPALTVGSGFAYVSNPNAGEILEVDLDTVSVSRTFSVEGQPVNMTALDWVAPLGPAPADDTDHSHEPVVDLPTDGIRLTIDRPYHIDVVDVPFPGASETELFGINNAGDIVGSYVDANDVRKGFWLKNGVFETIAPEGATDTRAFGINASGQITGRYKDANGVQHGFLREPDGLFITVNPGAADNFAWGINDLGQLTSYHFDFPTENDIVITSFLREPDGTFVQVPSSGGVGGNVFRGINDAGVMAGWNLPESGFTPTEFVDGLIYEEGEFTTLSIDAERHTLPDDIDNHGRIVGHTAPLDFSEIHGFLRTAEGEFHRFGIPGAETTIAQAINDDGVIVGWFEIHSEDGEEQIHGFIATPTPTDEDEFSHVYYASLSEGLNMISSPLKPRTPMNARSLAEMVGATTVIKLDDVNQGFVGWTPDAPDNGFSIEGAKGYIVNVPHARQVAFVGAPWTNQPQVPAAPTARSIDPPNSAWAFVVSGQLEGVQNLDGYLVTVRNLRTNAIMTNRVRDGYFAAATADLSRQSVVRVGDPLEVTVADATGEIASEKLRFVVTPETLANAVLPITLNGIGIPKQSLVLQNYPNPFNPETWIPYRLSESAPVTLSIYDTTGRLVRTLSIGFKPAGFYQGRARAAYWDGRNDVGERVSSGVYFYRLSTPSFHQMKRMVILK